MDDRRDNRQAIRGATLAELAIAVVILGIIIIAAFSIFSMNQIRIVRAMQDNLMVQVATNESERLLAIPYQYVVESEGRPVMQGGVEFTVDTFVELLSHPSSTKSSEVKEVTILVTAPSGRSYEVTLIRSP